MRSVRVEAPWSQPDSGTQYRSVILHHSEAQRAAAEAIMREVGGHYSDPVVTEVEPISEFCHWAACRGVSHRLLP